MRISSIPHVFVACCRVVFARPIGNGEQLTTLWMVAVGCILTARVSASDFCDTEVVVVSPGVPSRSAFVTAPSDAIVLFDGADLSKWKGSGGPAEWEVLDGVLTVKKGTGDIETERQFGDVQLHIEWRIPIDITGVGQARGNSGIYFQGRYELQILDSYENRTYADGQAGAVYDQAAPLVNVMRKPGEWNVYDAIYIAPRFNEDGSLFSPARLTVLHNGVLIQNNTEIRGSTGPVGKPAYTPHGRGSIRLQDHGDDSRPISFRNIWVRELGVTPAGVTEHHNLDTHLRDNPAVNTRLGDLLQNATARDVLYRCLPEVIPNPGVLEWISKMTLRQLQSYLPGLTDSKLERIAGEIRQSLEKKNESTETIAK